MRLVFACSPGKKHLGILEKCQVEHILVSYHFIKNVDKLMEVMDGYVPKTFILDSGAFSVWNNGGHIDLFSYMLFAKRLREALPPECELNVVNLDVLPGKVGERPTDEQREQSAIAGWENMLELEKEGLKVIHVYHQHEKIEWLDKLIKYQMEKGELPYIGISPANDVSMPEKLHFMDSCYAHIHKTVGLDKVRTHGFAVTSPEQLYRYPLFSADSSSWTSPARFGAIPLFYDDFSIKWARYDDKSIVLKHWDYLKSIGINELSADDWQTRTMVAIKTYQKLQKIATKLWTSRGIKWIS